MHRSRIAWITYAGLSAGTAVHPAWASANLLVNGSFENTTGATIAGSSPAAVGSLYGWTLSSSTTATPYGSGPGLGPELIVTNGTTPAPFGDKIGADPYTFGPDIAGQYALYLVDDGATETLSQTISVVAGTTYEVGFDLYQTPSGAGNAGGFTLTAALGGVTLDTATSAALAAGTWYHYAATYTPSTSGIVSFVFTYTSASGTSKDVVIDEVYVETPSTTPGAGPGTGSSAYVPEPAGWMVLLLAVPAALLGLRRRF